MNILTLAIAQRANKRDYQIIGLMMDSREIVSIVGVPRDNIEYEGVYNWDIGGITFVDKLIRIQRGEPIYRVDGKPSLKEPFNREELLRSLSNHTYGNSQFFINERTAFSIVKIISVNDIRCSGSEHYIQAIFAADSNADYERVSSNGTPDVDGSFILKELPVKDIRWINYWNWAKRKGLYSKKKKMYQNQFNKFYHDKYAVLYRSWDSEGTSSCSIVGLHLL